MVEGGRISVVVLTNNTDDHVKQSGSSLAVSKGAFLRVRVRGKRGLKVDSVLLSNCRNRGGCGCPVVPSHFPKGNPLKKLRTYFHGTGGPCYLMLNMSIPLIPTRRLTTLVHRSLRSSTGTIVLDRNKRRRPLVKMCYASLTSTVLRRVARQGNTIFTFLQGGKCRYCRDRTTT